jgi:AraC-like DNA-binding protein
MRAARSIAEFLADPVGRHVTGRVFVAWVLTPKLAGASYFGRIELADHEPLLEVFDLYKHPALAPPVRALLDGSGVETFDVRAYELLARYAGKWPDIAPRVDKVAIVRPRGMANAVSAGLFHELSPAPDGALFASRADAFAWLGADGSEVEAAVRAANAPPLLRELRRYLGENLQDASLESAARALASSPRSVQRALADAGTTFRAELDRERIAKALELLDTDAKIETIAAAVGCKSTSVFYELFRRHTGETPRNKR